MKKINFLSPSLCEKGDAEISEVVGKSLLKERKYHLAQKFLVYSNDLEAEKALLDEWMKDGNPEEEQYFISRYLLM